MVVCLYAAADDDVDDDNDNDVVAKTDANDDKPSL